MIDDIASGGRMYSDTIDVCCVTCCTYHPTKGGQHAYLLRDTALCMWCPRCGHVYSARCEEHR